MGDRNPFREPSVQRMEDAKKLLLAQVNYFLKNGEEYCPDEEGDISDEELISDHELPDYLPLTDEQRRDLLAQRKMDFGKTVHQVYPLRDGRELELSNNVSGMPIDLKRVENFADLGKFQFTFCIRAQMQGGGPVTAEVRVYCIEGEEVKLSLTPELDDSNPDVRAFKAAEKKAMTAAINNAGSLGNVLSAAAPAYDERMLKFGGILHKDANQAEVDYLNDVLQLAKDIPAASFKRDSQEDEL